MNSKFSWRFTTISLALLMPLSIVTSFPATANKLVPNIKQTVGANTKGLKFKLPRITGASGNREGGASRGGCNPEGKKLTALWPETNIGITVEPYPTFMVYLPKTNAKAGQLVIYENDDKLVYQTTFPLSKASGVVKLSVPANENIPQLVVGKQYSWYLAIICDSESEDDNGELVVSGWIKMHDQTKSLASQLEKMEISDRLNLYAENGLWPDLLKTLADLRSSKPRDTQLRSEWEDLLKSDPVLANFADEPLLKCCTPEKTSSKLNEKN